MKRKIGVYQLANYRRTYIKYCTIHVRGGASITAAALRQVTLVAQKKMRQTLDEKERETNYAVYVSRAILYNLSKTPLGGVFYFLMPRLKVRMLIPRHGWIVPFFYVSTQLATFVASSH